MLPQIKTVIYFPTVDELKDEPYLLYVDRDFGTHLRANPDLQELQRGRFGMFLASRCQPYTEERWETCQRWARVNRHVRENYKRLAKGLLEMLELDQ